MEIPHSIVLLHSKYSPNCKKFIDLLNLNNIDYILPVCIDNKDVREKIMNSLIEIQIVPSLLFVYGSGNIEKFEGESAFKWLEEIIIKKNQAEQMERNSQQPVVTQIEEEKIEVQKKKKKVVKEESSSSESEEEIEQPPKKSKNRVVKVSEKYDEDEVKSTSINDLMDINEIEGSKDFVSTNRNQTEKMPVKENNIMMKVQEMQRMRDQEDAKLPKKPY